MGSHRIQKLLFNEYRELGDEMVLIESPFAQTTRDGKGIRQVHLGLTPSKLIVASDILLPADISSIYFPSDADPEIESFELLSVFPIQCLTLSIFRRKRRRVLKARFCNDRVLYFELGGNKTRRMLWTLWLERVRFMNPSGSNSRSETSFISSTSASSSMMYLATSRMSFKGSRARLLQLFESTNINKNNSRPLRRPWTDRDLYLGPQDADWKMYQPSIGSLILDYDNNNNNNNNKRSFGSEESKNNSLEIEDRYKLSISHYTDIEPKFNTWLDHGVSVWMVNSLKRIRPKHPRRWGISPQPLFLHGFGPWRLSSGTKTLTKLKPCLSCVCIARLPEEPELQLPVSKRQLSITISCTNLTMANKEQNKTEAVCCCRWRDSSAETLLEKNQHFDPLRKLRDSVRLHTKVSAWDIDSAVFAHTLNCIDSTLCSRISPEEITSMLIHHRPVPEFHALVAFSHRISCLVATEILRESNVRLRARLIARFINVAEKCAQMGNFQSCQSILSGLQSPAIYRLEETWSHLRHHHSSRYHSLELMCRRHGNPSTELFLSAWNETARYKIRVPSLNHLVSSMLNLSVEDGKYQKQGKKSLDSITEIRKNIPPQFLFSNKKDFISKSNFNNTNLKMHNLAFEFLFKARYREEMVNFYRSFQLESNVISQSSEFI